MALVHTKDPRVVCARLLFLVMRLALEPIAVAEIAHGNIPTGNNAWDMIIIFFIPILAQL